MAGEVFAVTSKVKEYIKSKGCQTSGDAVEELNKKIKCLLDQAVCRVKANGRATVKPQDL